MELGVADFVSGRGSGSAPLFPEAIPAKHRTQVLDPKQENPAPSDKLGDVLDHAIRGCIKRQLGDAVDGLSVHSFHHYVNESFLEMRGDDGVTLLVPDMDRRDVLGHKPIDVNIRTYRHHERPLGPLHTAISRLPRLF
ncbi:MAG: hypothetical protein AAF366_20705 [Pseudomonadota bacterium]